MQTDTNSTGVSVELIVRSGAPSRGTVSRTRQLAGMDVFDTVDVTRADEEIGLSSTACRSNPGRWVLDRIAASRRWATDVGVSIAPFIGTREMVEPVTGEVYTTLMPPSVMLIEETDGEISYVTPHRNEVGTTTVRDRLTELEPSVPGREGRDAAVANG